MCKYCELKNGESICLTDRKHDDLYISKVEDEYYIENEGLAKFKLKYCPKCGRNLQSKEEAFQVYKQYKEKLIKDVIDSYEGKIPEPHYSKLRDAMYNYKVEIDD